VTAAPRNVSRRDLLNAGAGLVVGIALAPTLAPAQSSDVAARLPGSLNGNRLLSAWLHINPNGTVTVFTGKVEFGQGIASALAQMAADELDVDYRRIDMVTADTSRTPDESFTAGSQSIEQSGAAVRFACAEARQLLLAAAAARLGVEEGGLTVADGMITAPGGEHTTYWAVTTDAMLGREASAQAKPKAAGEYKLIGRSLARRDIPPKFTGGAAYLQDLRLPGMVHARIGRPPVLRAQLVSLDEAALRAMPGVIEVVRDGSFVAVVCKREEQAINARLALRGLAVWGRPALAPAISETFDGSDPGLTTHDSVVYQKTAPNASAAVRQIEAHYTRAFQLHASIGPSCAVACSVDGKLMVWTHSQGVFALRSDIARALGIALTKVTCLHMEGSGCYGHNGADDAAFDAALVARAIPGKPVRVQWMRDDEFSWEPFGSAMSVKMRAGLGGNGDILDWQHELWSYPHSRRPGGREGVNLLAASYLAHPLQPTFPADVPQPSGGSDRNAIPIYDFPRQKILKHYMPDVPLRTSALRSLGAYANVFAIESFMDEAASATSADPVEFRLRHLHDERAQAVIAAAAKNGGWRPDAPGDGGRGTGGTFRGRGIGFARYKNHACYCAVVAEVEVDRISGIVRVTRAWSAVDAGLVINPDGIVNQIEGGLIQSTSWTLKEALKVDRSGGQARSWSDYPILRFSEVPIVEVELIPHVTEDSLGVGEGAQGPTAAAIANAFAAATGRRLRDIPFTPERVKAALASDSESAAHLFAFC
jgi:CO/xanthine dehydrogenase Mo-binding subunit